jgi:hypothetical protein
VQPLHDKNNRVALLVVYACKQGRIEPFVVFGTSDFGFCIDRLNGIIENDDAAVILALMFVLVLSQWVILRGRSFPRPSAKHAARSSPRIVSLQMVERATRHRSVSSGIWPAG